MSHSPKTSNESQSVFERPGTSNLILGGVAIVAVLLVLADLVVHKHAHFAFEETIGFHAFFGFLAYVCIVNAAKLLRLVVKRSEDYYNE